jgi:hypothetical protein
LQPIYCSSRNNFRYNTNTTLMRKEKIDVIIETFMDYIECYYDETCETVDISNILNDHFGEFAEWAYDDFVINEEERDALLNSNERELHEKIKRFVVSEFLLILNNQ